MARRARLLLAVHAARAALCATVVVALGACSWSLEGFSGGAAPDGGGPPVDAAAGADGANDAGAGTADGDAGAADGEAGASGASLSIDPHVEPNVAYDLTALGPIDWTEWAKALTVRCGPCAVPRIGTLQYMPPGIGYSDDSRTFTWNNGAPTAAGSTHSGTFIVGEGHSFDLDVAAAPALALLTIHVDTYRAGASITVRIDGAQVAPQHVDLPAMDSGVAYGIDVRFSGPIGSSLHVTYTMTTDLSANSMDVANIAMIAATLAPAP